jgi:hypothetical protein
VRAGIKVTLASVDKIQVTAARGMTLTADILIADVKDDFSMLILPGGAKGAQRIAANPTAEAMVRYDMKIGSGSPQFALPQLWFCKLGSCYMGTRQPVIPHSKISWLNIKNSRL